MVLLVLKSFSESDQPEGGSLIWIFVEVQISKFKNTPISKFKTSISKFNFEIEDFDIEHNFDTEVLNFDSEGSMSFARYHTRHRMQSRGQY